MEQEKIGKNKKDDENTKEYFPDISNTVSSTECTGVMFAPPQNEEEEKSYQELSSMSLLKENEDI